MNGFVQSFLDFVKYLSQVLPLEVFVFVGSIIEELVGPIPSPLIMTSAGSLALSQQRGFAYLLLLALLGSAGKMVISVGLYYLGDKAEHIVVHKFGKYLGIQQSSIDQLRSYFSKDWKDDAILFLLRAIPIFPTGSVSIVCGVLRLRWQGYIIASTLGFIVRGMIYLAIGYYGLESLKEGIGIVGSNELLIIGGAIIVFGLVFALFRNERVQKYVQKIQDKYSKKDSSS